MTKLINYRELSFKQQNKMKTIPTQLLNHLGNDLLANIGVHDLMRETTAKLVRDICEKREKVIAERLKQIIGIDLDIKAEANRRFKRFAIEYKGNEEIIYFNDGSEQGIKVVTFVSKENPPSITNNKCQMSVEYSYY